MKSYGSFFESEREFDVGAEKRKETYLIESPLYFVREHPVHVRHDLDRHVDQALTDDKADVAVVLRK